MPTFSFKSDAPSAYAADVDHGELGARLEQLMRHEAYLDPFHKDHIEVVDRVQALARTIWGDKPISGESQEFKVVTINSATGEFVQPTIATGQGTPDEHSIPGHRTTEGG
jgi:hypothetical protein